MGDSDLRSTVAVHTQNFPGWDFSHVPEDPPELADPSGVEGNMSEG